MPADLRALVRDVPDFPKPGILFRDLTPLMRDPAGWQEVVRQLAAVCERLQPDLIVGIESRGFIVGTALATVTRLGFVPVRKPGKLPAETIQENYTLEYGMDSLQIHADAIAAGDRVLIVDDLLATGGTARATCDLVEQLGGEIYGLAFVVELTFLPGRKKLEGYDVYSLLSYDT